LHLIFIYCPLSFGFDKATITPSGQENLEYGRRDPSSWPRGTLYPQKLALTSPTSGGRPRTQATEFFFSIFFFIMSENMHFIRGVINLMQQSSDTKLIRNLEFK
jgi:hypothetical protein